MVRHIVLTRFKHSTTEAEINELYRAFESLVGQLDNACGFTGGRSKSPEQIERGYLHGFVIDFDSWNALQHYADHPVHRQLGAQLVELAEGGMDGLLVFDLEV